MDYTPFSYVTAEKAGLYREVMRVHGRRGVALHEEQLIDTPVG